MKILHTSDWHLGKSLEQFSRIEEQEKFLTELNQIVKNNQIDLVLVAGDIYDTPNPQAKAEQLFYEYINKINNDGKVPIVLIAGNHDSAERLIASNPILAEKGVFIVGKYNDTVPKVKNKYFEITETFLGGFKINIKSSNETATIINMPFPTEKTLNELINYETEKDYQRQYSEKVVGLLEKSAKHFEDETINILMAHIFAQGGISSDSEREIQIGGAYTVNVENLLTNCDYIALGHMHRAQQLKKATCPCYYSGSPIQYSKSEVGNAKSVYITEINKEKEVVVRKELLTDYKQIKIIKADSFEDALEQCEVIKDIDCYVYFEFNLPSLHQSEINELKKIIKSVVNIEFKGGFYEKLDESVDYQSMTIEELFKEFYKSNKGSEPDEEVLNIFSSLFLDEEF